VKCSIIAGIGNSNDKIYRNVISRLHDPTKKDPTHMVVVWSHLNRQEVALNKPNDPEHVKLGFRYNKDGKRSNWSLHTNVNMFQFSPSRPEWAHSGKINIINNYYKDLWNEHTSILDLLTKMQSLELICQSKGIKLIQCQYTASTKDTLTSCMDMKRFSHMNPWRENVEKILKGLRKESKVGLQPDELGFDMNTRANKLGQTLRYGHPNESVHTWYAKQLEKLFKDSNRWKTYFQPQKKGS
jgi:hypothetical protein